MSQSADELIEQARQWVGAEPGARKVGRDPVNRPMIHHWCQALEDRNPVYLDPEVAERTRHDGLVAPPGMLQTWTMDAPDGADDGGPSDQVLNRLDAAGYTSVVATNYEHEYHRELRVGDVISQTTAVEDLSDEKSTALGPGYFVTVRHEYRDQDDELVGIGRMRLLKFRPPADEADGAAEEAGGEQSATAGRPVPPINRDNEFFWDGVAAGRLLIQRCGECGELRHPPRPMCGVCRSTEWDTVEASGRGEIYSYVVHHHPPLPGVETPHPVVLVELEEGVRIVSNVEGLAPDDVSIGMPVELAFAELHDELTLPVFRPRET